MTPQTVWHDAAGPLTLNADQTNFSGYTHRQIIAAGSLNHTGLLYVRVTFAAAAAQALTIGVAYIGQAADSGDAYDFAATPTELLFSGGHGFAIAAGASIVSDQTTFSIPSGKNLIVSFYVSGDATHDDVRGVAAQSGWTNYWKLANDPATVNTSGYTLNSTKVVAAVSRIETASLFTPRMMNII